MSIRLGVPKAILEYVLFCHQEDANWFLINIYFSRKSQIQLQASFGAQRVEGTFRRNLRSDQVRQGAGQHQKVN